MALRIYNTLTRKKEDFEPLTEGRVGMYVCGPTVYDHPHLGHAKSYVSFDVVARFLRHSGYKVRYVQNITDVGHLTDNADGGEDKIIKRAVRERVEPMELVETYMRSYFEDMDALGNLRPEISPRAAAHVPEMIELVKTLLCRNLAYKVNGSVYFKVRGFADYGKLSGRQLDDMEAGARVDVNQEKRDPADFALWKRAEPEHIMRWLSPWGEGFPGWHIECSAMATKYLGETIDIHGGGLENAFPHHECEIAQSEGASGKPFVRYWMHNNMVTVDGIKMGKSLGNFVTLKDAFLKHSPMTVRLFVLSAHYRSPLDYSEDALDAAEKGLKRLQTAYRALTEKLGDQSGVEPGELPEPVREQEQRFLEAMEDDFNSAAALAALFDMAHMTNAMLAQGDGLAPPTMKALVALYDELAWDVLGLRLEERDQGAGPSLEAGLVDVLIGIRCELRKAKQFDMADAVRDRLAALGVQLEDTADGTVWHKA